MVTIVVTCNKEIPMRKLAILALLAIMLAPAAQAAYTNAIQDNVYWYEYVPADPTQGTGYTGLSSNQDWVCFSRSNVAYFAASQAVETGALSDMKSLFFGLGEMMYDVLADLEATNAAPSKLTINKSVRSSSTADIKFTHTIETDLDLTDVTPDTE
jgi:hypothetical protein